MNMRKHPEASGFSGESPEGEIPKPTDDDIEEVIRAAAHKTAEDLESGHLNEDRERSPILKYGDYLVDDTGKRFHINGETLGPWSGGGRYQTETEDGRLYEFTFAEVAEKLASGQYFIEGKRPLPSETLSGDIPAAIGDVLVSRSGTRRTITGVTHTDKGGAISFDRLDSAGNKSSGSMTFDEFYDHWRAGTFTIEKH